MKVEVPCNTSFQVIVLNIYGVYAQIHDQFFCNKEKLEKVKNRYSDKDHWKIVVLDF